MNRVTVIMVLIIFESTLGSREIFCAAAARSSEKKNPMHTLALGKYRLCGGICPLELVIDIESLESFKQPVRRGKKALRPSAKKTAVTKVKITTINADLIKVLHKDDSLELKASLDAGLHVDTQATDGASLLHLAVQCGALTCMRFLLARGANIRAIDENGSTVAHYLCSPEILFQNTKKFKAIFNTLAQRGGLNVAQRHSDGATLLHTIAYATGNLHLRINDDGYPNSRYCSDLVNNASLETIKTNLKLIMKKQQKSLVIKDCEGFTPVRHLELVIDQWGEKISDNEEIGEKLMEILQVMYEIYFEEASSLDSSDSQFGSKTPPGSPVIEKRNRNYKLF